MSYLCEKKEKSHGKGKRRNKDKRASSTNGNIDKTSYKSTGQGMWEFDGGSGKYGYATVLQAPNPEYRYDGVKNIYEVSVTSKDFKRSETNKFYGGFNQVKKWGKEKLKEYNK